MAQAVACICGGMWLVSVEELQRQVDAGQEEQATRLADLREYEEAPGSRPESAGLRVDSARF